ncbi:MAG: hemerythrin, partial [Clostridiales bacterium]|nr:hemerythrin [Clostridiales bacterium]
MLWNKRLETGIEQIDEQHKELFRRIDALNDVSNKNRIPETLAFLQEYVIKHFTDEQLLHKSVGYTKASTHAGYHDAFIRTL